MQPSTSLKGTSKSILHNFFCSAVPVLFERTTTGLSAVFRPNPHFFLLHQDSRISRSSIYGLYLSKKCDRDQQIFANKLRPFTQGKVMYTHDPRSGRLRVWCSSCENMEYQVPSMICQCPNTAMPNSGNSDTYQTKAYPTWRLPFINMKRQKRIVCDAINPVQL